MKEEMSNCFSSALPLNLKEDILNNILRSSSSTPVKKVISYGDELYKLVPKVKGYNKSSFYISKQEFNILKNAREIEPKLGLPLNSHAIEYDVYKATANQNIIAYESTIAKTKQGKYTTTGGAKQTFLLDDSKWTITLENKTLIPLK